ncbi:MAG: DNA-directed RNA polymerase subunit L [archaeon]
MEIIVLESTKTRLKFELVGKTHTLGNILAKELWQDKDIEFAGYHLEHPQTKNAVLIIEVKKGDPKKALIDAIARLEKQNKEFIDLVKKALK